MRGDDELGDLFGSHLVPAYFFVDEEGLITKKLVGYEEEAEVLAEVAPRIAVGTAAPAGGR